MTLFGYAGVRPEHHPPYPKAGSIAVQANVFGALSWSHASTALLVAPRAQATHVTDRIREPTACHQWPKVMSSSVLHAISPLIQIINPGGGPFTSRATMVQFHPCKPKAAGGGVEPPSRSVDRGMPVSPPRSLRFARRSTMFSIHPYATCFHVFPMLMFEMIRWLTPYAFASRACGIPRSRK